MVAGIMAGFGLWGSMFPIDTVKSKMQGDSLSNPQYKSTMDCYKQVRLARMHPVTALRTVIAPMHARDSFAVLRCFSSHTGAM